MGVLADGCVPEGTRFIINYEKSLKLLSIVVRITMQGVHFG